MISAYNKFSVCGFIASTLFLGINISFPLVSDYLLASSSDSINILQNLEMFATIMDIFLILISLITGIISWRQIKLTKEKGKFFSLFAILIGLTPLYLLILLMFWIIGWMFGIIRPNIG